MVSQDLTEKHCVGFDLNNFKEVTLTKTETKGRVFKVREKPVPSSQKFLWEEPINAMT